MKVDWDAFYQELLEQCTTGLDIEELGYVVNSAAVSVVVSALEKYHELLLSSNSEGNSTS